MASQEEKNKKFIKKLDKIKDYTDWLHDNYSKIVFGYVDGTARIENVMNYCLAYHFVKDSEQGVEHLDLQHDFIQHITSQIHFRSRYGMFRAILTKRYPTLFDKYKDKIDLFSDLFTKRNNLAHATLYGPPDIIKQFNKTRILYFNAAVSENPVQITLAEFKDDKIAMHNLFYDFFFMGDAIKHR